MEMKIKSPTTVNLFKVFLHWSLSSLMVFFPQWIHAELLKRVRKLIFIGMRVQGRLQTKINSKFMSLFCDKTVYRLHTILIHLISRPFILPVVISLCYSMESWRGKDYVPTCHFQIHSSFTRFMFDHFRFNCVSFCAHRAHKTTQFHFISCGSLSQPSQ